MNKLIKITYGESMYGGWYADFFYLGEYRGIHANTLKELTKQLNSIIGLMNEAWCYYRRIDN